jgi:hypothetical protein
MNGNLHPNHENRHDAGNATSIQDEKVTPFSYLNLENTGYWEGSPPQGLFEARRGKFGFRETGN